MQQCTKMSLKLSLQHPVFTQHQVTSGRISRISSLLLLAAQLPPQTGRKVLIPRLTSYLAACALKIDASVTELPLSLSSASAM